MDWARLSAGAAGLLLCAGLTHAVTVDNAPAGNWPTRTFSPYVDITLWPTPRIDQLSAATGAKHFNIAFLVADGGGANQVNFGGYSSYPVSGTSVEDASWDFGYNFISGLNNLRAAGGDIKMSFGGANGTPIDARITNPASLVAEYQRVIDTYRLKAIDFDIEGSWAADAASIARRSAAIKTLQQNNPNLKVSFTLSVLPSGLTSEGLSILSSALTAGARIDELNIMAMDYGDSAAPNPAGKMGTYAIAAATSTQAQLKALLASKGLVYTDAQVWAMLGVTPMLGVNDVSTEVFTPADAQQLLTFANQKGLAELSFWSINRDHPGSGFGSTNDSGIAQSDYAFTSSFAGYGIPEPSSGLVIGAGAALGLLRRGRRKMTNGKATQA